MERIGPDVNIHEIGTINPATQATETLYEKLPRCRLISAALYGPPR